MITGKEIAKWWRKADVEEFGEDSGEVKDTIKDYKKLSVVFADVANGLGLRKKVVKEYFTEMWYSRHNMLMEYSMLVEEISKYYYN